MKKRLLILLSLVFVVGLFLVLRPPHGFRNFNYVGMTREQIIAQCPSYDRFLDGQIMILVEPAFCYFKTADEIRKNPEVMKAPKWGINFKRGLVRTHFFEVYFENDVVVRQNKSWYGDI